MLFLAVGMLYLSLWEVQTAADTISYQVVAQDLQDLRLDELSRRPIGYPLILLLTGSAVNAQMPLLVFQLVCALAAIAASSVMLRHLQAHPLLIALFIGVAILPIYMGAATYAMTESTASSFLLLGLSSLVIFLCTKQRSMLFVGVLFLAFLPFIRPTFQFLSLILALVMGVLAWAHYARRESLSAGIALLVSTFIFQGGMVLYNHTIFDYVGLSPMTGISLTYRTEDFIEELPEEYEDVRGLFLEGFEAHGQGYVYNIREDLAAEKDLDGWAELDSYLTRLNIGLIMTNPVDYIQAVLRDIPLFWEPHDPYYAVTLGIPLLYNLQVFVYFSTLAVSSVGLLLLAKNALTRKKLEAAALFNTRMVAMILIMVTVLYTMGISIGVNFGMARFRAPIDILIVVFTCLVIDTLIMFEKNRSSRLAP